MVGGENGVIGNESGVKNLKAAGVDDPLAVRKLFNPGVGDGFSELSVRIVMKRLFLGRIRK